MKIIVVDDEKLIVDYIENLLRQIQPEAEFVGFIDADDAFDYLAEHTADIALLDIELGEYNGIQLAKRCNELCPKINIIFVTGYSKYTMDALRLHASGYLLKPIQADELRNELNHLRHPLPADTACRVRIQTFGNFEVFVDGKPLRMPLAKCRECLAYLVDRKGAMVTVAELAAVLWEDKPLYHTVRNSVHQVISNLMKTLKDVNAEAIIIRHPREIGIDLSKVDCDYYRVLSGDTGLFDQFTGEYMSNYSWAEFTTGALVEKNLKTDRAH